MIEIIREPSRESAAAAAGEQLNNLLLENAKQPVLFMLSAGSALGMLEYINAKNTGEHLTAAMLDDRFSQDHAVNNFAQLQKTDFYIRALGAGTNFFGSLPRNGETMDVLAQRMEKNLRGWKNNNPKGIILASLGMGLDGHTAGIFPYPENAHEFHRLFESENWVTGYDAANPDSLVGTGKVKYSQRLTATLTFFKLIDFGVALVCGAEKKAKLNELLSGRTDIAELPALAWQKINSVKIFTDLD